MVFKQSFINHPPCFGLGGGRGVYKSRSNITRFTVSRIAWIHCSSSSSFSFAVHMTTWHRSRRTWVTSYRSTRSLSLSRTRILPFVVQCAPFAAGVHSSFAVRTFFLGTSPSLQVHPWTPVKVQWRYVWTAVRYSLMPQCGVQRTSDAWPRRVPSPRYTRILQLGTPRSKLTQRKERSTCFALWPPVSTTSAELMMVQWIVRITQSTLQVSRRGIALSTMPWCMHCGVCLQAWSCTLRSCTSVHGFPIHTSW